MKFNNYKGKNNIRWGILGKQKVYTAAPVLQEKKETASSFEPFNSKKDDFVRIDLIPRFVVGGGQSTISPSPSATPIPPSATPTMTPTPTNTTTPIITPTPSTTPSIYGPNLKMYLDASDTNSYNGSGTIWYDLTPNNNHAIMSGDSNSIFITTGSTSYFSLNFTATSQNQYFIVPDSNSLDVTSGITMEIWVYRNSVNTSNASLFNKQDNPGWGGRYGEYSFRFSGLGIETWVGGYFEGPAYGNPTNIPLDSWNQLVITWDTSDYSYRYYINGSLQATSSPTTATSIPTSIYPLWLGANLAGVTENFTGYMSIVRLYNKALSSVEVNNNWLADKTKFGL